MSATVDYGLVKTVVAIENPMVRRGTVELLRQTGFRNVVEASSFVKMHEIINNEEVDLIIANTSMSDIFVGQAIRDLRTELKSSACFTIAILLAETNDHDFLRKVIDCGPDDVLLMPFSPQQLVDRVKILAERRKPFIATFNYVGPDRRKQPRTEGEVIPLVDVPNPLKAKARKANPATLKAAGEAALQRLTTLRIQRGAIQLRWLSEAIRKLTKDVNGVAPEISRHLNLMLAVTQDLRLRTNTWSNTRLLDYLQDLENAASSAVNNDAPLDPGKIDMVLDVASKVAADISRVLS